MSGPLYGGLPSWLPTLPPIEVGESYRIAQRAYLDKLEQEHLEERRYRERVNRRWFALGYATFAVAIALFVWGILEALH